MDQLDTIKIYPTDQQILKLNKIQQDCIWVFNLFLDRELEFYDTNKCWIGAYTDIEHLIELLKDPDSPITTSLNCLAPVIKNLISRLNRHPIGTIKAKTTHNQIQIQNVDHRMIKLESVLLPGLGSIKAKPIKDMHRFDMISITNVNDKWWLTTGYDPKTPQSVRDYKPKTNTVTGKPVYKKKPKKRVKR